MHANSAIGRCPTRTSPHDRRSPNPQGLNRKTLTLRGSQYSAPAANQTLEHGGSRAASKDAQDAPDIRAQAGSRWKERAGRTGLATAVRQTSSPGRQDTTSCFIYRTMADRTRTRSDVVESSHRSVETSKVPSHNRSTTTWIGNSRAGSRSDRSRHCSSSLLCRPVAGVSLQASTRSAPYTQTACEARGSAP